MVDFLAHRLEGYLMVWIKEWILIQKDNIINNFIACHTSQSSQWTKGTDVSLDVKKEFIKLIAM